MDTINKSNIIDKLVNARYSISEEEDYILNEPVVTKNFEELVYDDTLLKRISSENKKLLTINVNNLDMVPTAMMFGMRDHMFIEKLVVLNKNIEGWKYILSFLLSSHIDKILLVRE